MSTFGYSMPGYFRNMEVIGAPLEQPNAGNEAELKKIEDELQKEMSDVLASGRSDESLNKSGQMTALQRLELLVDKGSWCPLNSLLNPYGNEDGSTGVITGLGKIHDKWAVIIASDNKKLAGAWVAGQAIKLTRATDMAKQLNIPLVYLLNCSGVKLDEQEKVYAGRITGDPFLSARRPHATWYSHYSRYIRNQSGRRWISRHQPILLAHEKANMAVGGAGIVGRMNPRALWIRKRLRLLLTPQKTPAGRPARLGIRSFRSNRLLRSIYPGKGVIEAIKNIWTLFRHTMRTFPCG